MKQVIFLTFLSFILIISPTLASEATDFELTETPSAMWYIGQWDKLALDVVIPSNNGQLDTLNALTVKNEGNAYYGGGLSGLRLWQDAGTPGFQGWGIDEDLGFATYRGVQEGWYWEDIDVSVAGSGTRFFVSAEMWPNPPATNVNYTVKLAIPAFYDANANGVFDNDDRGVFMGSGNNGPTDTAVTNYQNQTISYGNFDVQGPTVIFDNLANNEVITSNSYLIQGQARDQGNSSPEYVKVKITKVGGAAGDLEYVEMTSSNYLNWQYNWTNIEDGTYLIQTQAKDFMGYVSSQEPITVIVNKGGDLSQEFSSVSVDKTTAFADGQDPILITALVRNTDNYPITESTIYLKEVRDAGDVVVKATGSGDDGRATFSLRSNTATTVTYRVYIDEIALGENLNIEFLEVPETPPVVTEDWESGTWVKSLEFTAVYYLDANNVRHAYPTQEVWESYFGENFDTVSTIDAATLATYSLGRNVPFKIGTLMKLPTVRKVYQVEEGAVIRWITTEAKAIELHGADWADTVRPIPDSFFTDYTIGSDLE
jgi:hypothetical protein